MVGFAYFAGLTKVQRAIRVQSFGTSAALREARPPHPSESFLSGTNAVYVEEMYRAWKKDPSSVHASWNAFFRNVDSGAAPGEAFTRACV